MYEVLKVVREAVVSDIKEINRLGKLLNDNFEKLFVIEDILKEDFSKIFVYEKDSKVVGFLHITVLYEVIDIVNICVDPDYRRQKIASVLFDYMFSEFNENKCFSLEVKTTNKAAINLYKKFGFEIIHVRNNYYKDQDAYLMGRKN